MSLKHKRKGECIISRSSYYSVEFIRIKVFFQIERQKHLHRWKLSWHRIASILGISWPKIIEISFINGVNVGFSTSSPEVVYGWGRGRSALFNSHVDSCRSFSSKVMAFQGCDFQLYLATLSQFHPKKIVELLGDCLNV